MGWLHYGANGEGVTSCRHKHIIMGAAGASPCPKCKKDQEERDAVLAASYQAESNVRMIKWKALPLLSETSYLEIEDFDGETEECNWMPIEQFLKSYPYEWRVDKNGASNDPSSFSLRLR